MTEVQATLPARRRMIIIRLFRDAARAAQLIGIAAPGVTSGSTWLGSQEEPWVKRSLGVILATELTLIARWLLAQWLLLHLTLGPFDTRPCYSGVAFFVFPFSENGTRDSELKNCTTETKLWNV